MKEVWRSHYCPSRPASLGQNGAVCPSRIVSQHALSEVMQVFPTMKLKVFVDDITAFL